MSHEDMAHPVRVVGIGLHGGVGHHRNPGRVKSNARDKGFHLIMDHLHDGRVKGHAHFELGGPMALSLDFLKEVQQRNRVPSQDHLVGELKLVK